jgi:hypothetical protein
MKLKQKQILNILLLCAIITIVINDLIFNETPEIISFGDELGTILSNLSLAVGDFKASASYIRSEFERLVKNFCHDKKIPVKFNKNQSKIPGEDYWSVSKDKIKQDGTRYIPEALRNNIETQRTLVMNPFVHYDLNKPTFRAELVITINLVKQLKIALT